MSTEAEPVVLTRREGHILVVTVNRPSMRNAVDMPTAMAIEAAMDELDATDELFLAILTGAGDNFCAGADLKASRRGEPIGITEKRGGFGLFRRPPVKPLIAAVEGYAVGGGFEMCLACDLIVAAETAQFGLPEVRAGVLAGGGGLLRLPQRMPYHVAMELALTGEFRDAAYFERWGIVNKITAKGKALEGAMDMAERILVNAPVAVAATKEIIFQSAAEWSNTREGWDNQPPFIKRVTSSEDRNEGVAAFGEKRKPVWKGR